MFKNKKILLGSVFSILIVGIGIYHKNKEKSQLYGTIILLNGTSSAGKTSIIKELRKIYGNSYIYLNGDEFVEVYSNNYPMPELMQDYEYQVKVLSALCAYAKKLSFSGKNVVVDVVEFEDNYKDYLALLGDNKNIFKVLVYCPLDVIIDRIYKRNLLDDPKEKRELISSFLQFKNLYKIQEISDELIVDCVDTKKIKYALNILAKVMNEKIKTNYPEVPLFEEGYDWKNFYNKFQLNSFNRIILVPVHHWDFIVNTANNSPKEIALKIVQKLRKLLIKN